jgi:hypothetical protein
MSVIGMLVLVKAKRPLFIGIIQQKIYKEPKMPPKKRASKKPVIVFEDTTIHDAQPEPGFEFEPEASALEHPIFTTDQMAALMAEIRANAERQANPFANLRLGSMVYFVLDDGPGIGEPRPAWVVKLHNSTGLVNLQVLTNSTKNKHGSDVGDDLTPPLWWRTGISYNADHAYATWHWPEGEL